MDIHLFISSKYNIRHRYLMDTSTRTRSRRGYFENSSKIQLLFVTHIDVVEKLILVIAYYPFNQLTGHFFGANLIPVILGVHRSESKRFWSTFSRFVAFNLLNACWHCCRTFVRHAGDPVGRLDAGNAAQRKQHVLFGTLATDD